MKVLLLAPMGSVHRRFNGANISAIAELGYELHLLANFEDGEGAECQNAQFANYCEQKGIIIHTIPFVRASLLKNLLLIKNVIDLLKNEKFDFVHAHCETGGLILRMASCVKGNSKFLFTAHGMSFWKGSSLKSHIIYKPLERWICSGMDMNLGINNEEVETFAGWNNKTYSYVHGVGLNINRMQSPKRNRREVRDEFGVKGSEKLIVSIGELDDNKNHIVVIMALAMMNRKDFKYVICGVGPNKDMLLEQAIEVGLKDYIILAGYRSDIPDILNAADIFVFPSFHEGMPVSALEAMACSLPIICSKIRGNVDIIKDGNNGFLFNPADKDTLAKQLALLMNNESRCKEMGKKNRVIVKDFSMKAVSEELKTIYRKYEK